MTARKRRPQKRRCLFPILRISLCLCVVGIFCTVIYWKINGKTVLEVSIPYQEITIEEQELEQKFYFETLPEEEKTVYKEVLQGVRGNVKEIYVHSEDAMKTNKIFEYVLKDFPEIFWCDGTASATVYEGKEAYTVLKPIYLYQKEEKKKKQEQIDHEVELFLDTVPEQADDYEKILAVYEYIVDHVDYDMEASDNQNIYSVFVNQRSVCAGYSKATQYLLEKLDVFCTYITGKTSGNQSHAWNLVLCDGDYYYVDTTWGDPVFQGEDERDSSGMQVDYDNISYDFMCCDDDQISRTHTPDKDIKLPKCNRMDKNYYVVNDMYYTEYDAHVILDKMNDTIVAGDSTSVFKFADQETYKAAQEDIFGCLIEKAVQNLAEWYGLAKVQYRYLNDSELNKITIYWQYE